MKHFVFRDVYNSTGPGKSPTSIKVIVIEADDEEEAWRKFAERYAIGNFGHCFSVVTLNKYDADKGFVL